jgi:hypothetical protein
MALRFESKPTLVAYVTCGDPDLATTLEVILGPSSCTNEIAPFEPRKRLDEFP